MYSTTNALARLVVTPRTRSTLRRLRKDGIRLILLSTHPFGPRKSQRLLRTKLEHLGILKLFDSFQATALRPTSKPANIINILRRFEIPRSHALMVGDSYKWDYKPALKNRIPALLLDSDYAPSLRVVPKSRRISELSDILAIVRPSLCAQRRAKRAIGEAGRRAAKRSDFSVSEY